MYMYTFNLDTRLSLIVREGQEERALYTLLAHVHNHLLNFCTMQNVNNITRREGGVLGYESILKSTQSALRGITK